MNKKFEHAFKSANPELKPFFAFDYPYPDWEDVIKERLRHPINRVLLREVLIDLNKDLTLSNIQTKNIDSLLQKNTFTITTGHQPCFLGGPLFVFYKAYAVVKWCNTLRNLYPNYNFVPIFWIASEDHDIREINHTWLKYPNPTTYSHPIKGAVGRHKFNQQALNLLNIPNWLTEFYNEENTFSQAFHKLWNYVFREHGLLLLDADNVKLKSSFKHIILEEVINPFSQKIKDKQNEMLQILGYIPQAKGSNINMFYLNQNGRHKITKYKNGYLIDFVFWENEKLQNEIINNPRNFSPNVILRPLYQEYILPNIGYIGGWGELAYWAQLKQIFTSKNIFFPPLLPRPSAYMVPECLANILNENKLPFSAITYTEKWICDHWKDSNFDQAIFKKSKIELLGIINRLEQHNEFRSNFYQKLISGYKNASLKRFEKLEHRTVNGQIKRSLSGSKLIKYKKVYFPDGYIQERTANISQFYDGLSIREFSNKGFDLEINENATQIIIIR